MGSCDTQPTTAHKRLLQSFQPLKKSKKLDFDLKKQYGHNYGLFMGSLTL